MSVEDPTVKTDPVDPVETPKQYSEDEFKKVVSQRDALKTTANSVQAERDQLKAQIDKLAEDELKAKGNLQELLDNKEKELADAKKVLTEVETYKTKFEELDNSIRKNNLDKLEDDELRDIADALPTEKLIKFVEKHANAKDGMDTGRPGGKSKIKTEGKEWADFNSSELSILRETDFTAYSKLYKEKYKVEPTK